MPVAKLTERTVKLMGPKVGEDGRPVNVTYWDEDESGFGLQVTKSGAKSWVLKFIWGRRQDWFVFARYPGLTVEAARTKAKALKQQIREGVNPRKVRDERRDAMTMDKLADRALEEWWRPRGNPRSVGEQESILDQWVRPTLGKSLVRDVTDADIAKLHHAMRSTPIRANRALACLSKLFKLAERWGDRPKGTNPCIGLERYPEEKRKRYLSASEVLWFAHGLASQEERFPLAVAALRLLLFTGARKSEILGLRWSWVDLEANQIHLPALEHKTGKKSGDKFIPLSEPAKDLLIALAAMPRLGPFVFPGLNPRKPMTSLERAWKAVIEEARRAAKEDAQNNNWKIPEGFLDDLRIHDLRHTFASMVIGTGRSLPIVGALLGHTVPATTQRYAHLENDPLRQATEDAGEVLRKRMGGA